MKNNKNIIIVIASLTMASSLWFTAYIEVNISGTTKLLLFFIGCYLALEAFALYLDGGK